MRVEDKWHGDGPEVSLSGQNVGLQGRAQLPSSPSSDCARFELIDFWTRGPDVTTLVLRQKEMADPGLDFRQILWVVNLAKTTLHSFF